jgi:2-polyprenyl-6-methoxyphenol hydroxylase-like FAD-dependent oxidoreductase
MGGLLAARALSWHFERVTILERDPLAESGEPRKGTPQARQTHGLLAGGLAALKQYFPGIEQELIQAGAQTGDLLGDSLWHIHGGHHARFESGLVGVTCSRTLLEAVVRRRVQAIANVTLRDRMSVSRLINDFVARRVTGLEVVDRHTQTTERLDADLIVDCTGRGSRMPAWLEDLGYERPAEERVDVDLTYATQIFRKQPGDLGGNAVIILSTPPETRFAVALAIEHDRWSLTLGGMFGEEAAVDPAGFLGFARGVASPLIHEFLQTAEPLSEVVKHKVPGSLRRRYERLRRFPAGLLVLGDAMCSFNPVYGQGMTVAALEAQALDRCLEQGTNDLARRFFRAAAKIIDVPWQIAVTTDFQYRQTRGRRPWSAGLMNGYLGLVHRAGHVDPQVALAFHRVANLLAAPTSLLRPRIVLRVLLHCLRGKAGVQRCVPQGERRGVGPACLAAERPS